MRDYDFFKRNSFILLWCVVYDRYWNGNKVGIMVIINIHSFGSINVLDLWIIS